MNDGFRERYDDDAMECCCFCKEKEAWETDLSQTLSAFLPPFLLLVYDHGTDVYGKNARDKTLE